MRIASKCAQQPGVSTTIDATPDEFVRTMGYGARHYLSADEFFRFHSSAQSVELHDALREMLDPRRSVPIGSGECEHQIPFALQGSDVLASDIVDAAEQSRRLFPGLRFKTFDVLNPAGAAQGFRLGRMKHAGYAVELQCLYVDRLLLPVYKAVRALDRHLSWFNNVVVFEFLS